jgi:hypothetical protein
MGEEDSLLIAQIKEGRLKKLVGSEELIQMRPVSINQSVYNSGLACSLGTGQMMMTQ